MKKVLCCLSLLLVLPGMAGAAADSEYGTGADPAPAIHAWTTLHLAPRVIERCGEDFPDKTTLYRAAMRHWIDNNHALAASGEYLYRLLVKTQAPGKDPEALLAASVEKAIVRFNGKNRENRLAQCESIFLMLMVGTDIASP